MVGTRGRILVLGDSGVGKTSLVHKICSGEKLESSPGHTIGCAVQVKLLSFTKGSFDGTQGGGGTPAHGTFHQHGVNQVNQSQIIVGQQHQQEQFFVELLDVGCHANYELSRSMFYSQIDGVVLVYDVSNSKSFSNLRKWVVEVRKKVHPAQTVPRSSAGLSQSVHQRAPSSVNGSLPQQQHKSPSTINEMPVLVVGNKFDTARGWRSRNLPNVPKSLGFESSNTSSIQSGEVDKMEQFIKLVVDSRGGQECFPSDILRDARNPSIV